MRYTLRSVAFVLTLTSGIVIWYALAYRSVASVVPAQANVAAAHQTSTPPPQPEPAPAKKLISFGPVEGFSGVTNTEMVTLRRKPDAKASVFAKVELPLSTPVEILDVTREFIRVKFPAPEGSKYAEEGKAEYEGWTTWGMVVSAMSAIVLDSATGALVARVPLGGDHTAVTYSPDGSRALFHSARNYRNSILGYEVETGDYKLTRSLLASESDFLGQLFYSPVDGTIAALFGRTSVDEKRTLNLMRLGDFYTVDMPTKISASATGFIVAPDGRTGFLIHPQNSEREAAVDVVDLQSLEIRNTFLLTGTQISWPDGFTINRDGSEIYRDDPEADHVSVIDTQTGQTLRELPKRFKDKHPIYFTQSDLIGDSLFVKYWTETDDDSMHARPHTAWLGATGRLAADPEIDSVVEACGAGFAINTEGTHLFRLDKKHHIQERLLIERPELRSRKEAHYEFSVYGLGASPDGRHIIVFVGIYEGC